MAKRRKQRKPVLSSYSAAYGKGSNLRSNGSLTPFPVQIPEQDLSNILKIAGRINRVQSGTGYWDSFYDRQVEIAKENEARAKEAAKAEEAAAKQDLGNEPDSAGFWEKLGEGALDGAERVIDVLSRPNYAMANLALHTQKEQRKYDKKDLGTWDRITEGFKDIPTALGEMWDGFSGEDKTYFAKVIKDEAKHDKTDNFQDNSWYQGIAGFGLDVLTDPTTYIGVGLVKKPLAALTGKAAKELGEDVTEKKALDLADNIAKLGVKEPETGVELSREQVYSLITGRPFGKKRRLGAGATKAQRAEQANFHAQNIAKLKKMIRTQTEMHPSEVKHAYDDTLEHFERQFNQEIDDYAKAAFSKAGEKFDSKPELWPDKAGPKFVNDSIDFVTATRAFATEGTRRYLTGKGIAVDPEKLPEFADMLGDAWKGAENIPADFKNSAYGLVDNITRKDPVVRAEREKLYNPTNGLHTQKNQAVKRLERAKAAGDEVEYGNAEQQLKALQTSIDASYRKINRTQANVFMRLASAAAAKGDKTMATMDWSKVYLTPEQTAQLDELLPQLDAIEQRLATSRGASTTRTSNAAADDAEEQGLSRLDQEAGAQPKETQSDTALERERHRILRDIEKVVGTDSTSWAKGDKLDVPPSLGEKFNLNDQKDFEKLFEVNARGDLKVKTEGLSPEEKAFAREIKTNIETKADQEYSTKVKTWARQEREHDLAGRSAKVDEMFDDKGIPKITLDGKTYAKNDPKLKAAIESRVNDADRAKYRGDASSSAKNEGTTAKGDLEARVNPERDVSIADVAARNKDDVVKHGAPAAQAAHHNAFDRLFEAQHGLTVKAAITAKKTSKGDAVKYADRSRAVPVGLRNKFKKEALFQARREVQHDLKRGNLTTIKSKELITQRVAQQGDDLEASWRVMREQAKLDFQQKAAQAARAKPRANSRAAKTQARINELRAERDAKFKQIDAAYNEAKLTREAMADRMDEQLLLDLIDSSPGVMEKGVRLSFAGKTLGIGKKHIDPATGKRLATFSTPKMLTAATEKIGGLPILQKAHAQWAQAFAPASKLNPDLNDARLRMQGNVNDVIKHHIDELFHAYRPFTKEQRQAAFQAVLKGAPVGNNGRALYETTQKFLDDLVPYTNGSMKIGDETLELSDLNKYLADEYKFLDADGRSIKRTELHSGKEILEAMRRLKPGTDPLKALWNLRIASEKAMAEKAMRYTIGETFGIRRILKHEYNSKDVTEELVDQRNMIEALRDKHGWTTVDGFNERYYFEPEVAKDIEKLFDMMKPGREAEVLKTYDKAMRAWKATVTVYNPGYYTRNAIGEVMMGMFDNVGPKFYPTAASILKYAQPDEVNEALKHITPWKKFQTTRQAGARVALKTKYGKKLSYEDVWVLFHEHNLKSGFISSEMDHYFPAANKLRSTPVGQFASKINDKVRSKGEKFEDYFRLAHFMDRMARSNHRSIEAAAKEAARYTRKYHFDYTDFTPFEKAWMMRAFPFYKWTRKAMPMMGAMLFTKPATVNFYPKAMSAISVGTGGVDPMADENGFQPNYEDVTPEWIRGLMAYPMGRDDENNMTYGHLATPAFDVFKMMQNPVSATIGMMNPAAKLFMEQGRGETLDPKFQMDVKSGEERWNNLMRITPATSMLEGIRDSSASGKDSTISEPGAPMDEKLASFLTGLGLYENNPARQQGELMNRAKKGK